VLKQLELLDLSGFMFAAGLFFIVVTLAVAVLKTEEPLTKEEEPEGVAEAYRAVYSMLQLKPVRTLVVVLFTWKLGFAVIDSVAPLKFQEYGLPKEHLTYLSTLLMPLEILLPLAASRWTCGASPFGLAMQAYPVKVAIVPVTAMLAYLTPPSMLPKTVFWVAMVAVALVRSVTTEWMFVSQIALFARISDPAIGGTAMSALNTMANLGQKLPPTATFFLVDRMTCLEDSCPMKVDGFYAMTCLCTAIGVAWYALARRPVEQLQALDLSEWRVGSVKEAKRA